MNNQFSDDACKKKLIHIQHYFLKERNVSKKLVCTLQVTPFFSLSSGNDRNCTSNMSAGYCQITIWPPSYVDRRLWCVPAPLKNAATATTEAQALIRSLFVSCHEHTCAFPHGTDFNTVFRNIIVWRHFLRLAQATLSLCSAQICSLGQLELIIYCGIEWNRV